MAKLDLFPEGKLPITLARLCHQLIEHHGDFADTAIIGIQPRGVFVARRIHLLLSELLPDMTIPYGELDVTFFRDDIRLRDTPISPNSTHIDFYIEGKKVILIDDVLYTGRTVRSALDAMLAFGRPQRVELLTLVKRRRVQELPIAASYAGIEVDTLHSERVVVALAEAGGEDKVYLIS